jgi:hypothetical protein
MAANSYVIDPVTEKYMEESIPEGDLILCYNKDDLAFSCMSTRDVIIAIATGDLINPNTGLQYDPEFIQRIENKYADVIAKVKAQPPQVPGLKIRNFEPVIEKKIVPPPQKVVPQKSVLMVEKPKKVKPPRVRYVAPKKGDYEPITGMLLLGDVETFALVDVSFVFSIIAEDDDGSEEIVDEEIPITFDTKKKGLNVVVLTISADQFKKDALHEEERLKSQLKLVPKYIKKIYIAGLDAEGITPKDRALFAGRLRRIVPGLKRVFYTDGDSEDDIRDILIDVAVDVEGVKAQ